MPKRVVIDGSNLYHAARESFSALQKAIMQIEDMGSVHIKTFVDASLFRKLKPSEKNSFEEMEENGVLQQTPSGSEADLFILRWASDHDAIVVSNDGYSDKYEEDSKELKSTGRLCGAVFDAHGNRWQFAERFNQSDSKSRDLFELLKLQKDSAQKDTHRPFGGNYSARVTSKSPALIIILVDQSSSMDKPALGTEKSKAEVVADCVNQLIEELVLKSTKDFSEPKPYFDLTVIGYGRSEKSKLQYLLRGTNEETPFVAIDELNRSAVIVGGRPTWIRPISDGGTPMCAAFKIAAKLAKRWVRQHIDNYPPVVFNVTDGAPTDGDPMNDFAELSQVSTSDGATLIFNAHIADGSGKRNRKSKHRVPNGDQLMKKISYPSSEKELSDELAKQLFRLSSPLPQSILEQLGDLNDGISTGACAMIFNGSPEDLVKLFNLGTPAR